MALFSWTKTVTFASVCFMFCLSLNAQTGSSHIGCATPKRPVHVYYADPIKGSMKGDGSYSRPWGSLASIINANLINGQDNSSGVVHAGDLIYLLTGDHGNIVLSPNVGTGKVSNTEFITIQAAPGKNPTLQSLNVQNAAKWVFRGLTIQNPPNYTARGVLVSLTSTENILFDSNIVYSVPNAVNWTPQDWATSSSFIGIQVQTSTSVTVSNNKVSNVEKGIWIAGNSINLFNNLIDYFADDGIDFSVSNSILSHNTVTNHYGQWDDGRHHDGMQGFAYDINVTYANVLIDSNVILASTGSYPTIPVLPTNGADDLMQGLSIFDGAWDNVTVTNNVVVARNNYHALSMYRFSNSVIANNTVFGQSVNPSVSPWLAVFNPDSNVIVRNNIANRLIVAQPGVVVDDHNISLTGGSGNSWSNVPSNIVVSDPTTIFVKYQPSTGAYDFNLINGSPAIGAGSAVNAPNYDVTGKVRNPLKIDLGAYAY
ncbi:MAG: right-handed parallel beta-helix repeat-containing protein [Schlesneria sp.]